MRKQLSLFLLSFSLLSTNISANEITCLTDVIYHESRGESHLGKIAIANVVFNRIDSGKFPNNVCGVVYQKTGKTYQFSWTKKKKKVNPELYDEIKKISKKIYADRHKLPDTTNGATFFHSTSVSPRWKGLTKTAKIGKHIFYRAKR